MPSPTRIVTARHPSRIPKPPSRAPVERTARVVPAKGIAVTATPAAGPTTATPRPKPPAGPHDTAALTAAADRVWRIVAGLEEG